MPTEPHHSTGVTLVVISAIVFSFAGIFTKSVSADAWSIIFWRGLSAAGFTLSYLALRGQLRAEISAFGRPALAIALLGAAGTAAFIPAFKLSSVAHVALIYASAPFWAAGLAWVFLKEPPNRHVMLASLAALAGVAIILAGSLGAPSLIGDGLALIMTLMMAGVMVVYRARPKTTAALPAAVSSIILLPVALIFGDHAAPMITELPVLIAFGLVFAIAAVTLSEGARRLPPAETALLSALEVPLAPILAWLLLSEMPTARTFAGGGLICVAIVLSQISTRSRHQAGNRRCRQAGR